MAPPALFCLNFWWYLYPQKKDECNFLNLTKYWLGAIPRERCRQKQRKFPKIWVSIFERVQIKFTWIFRILNVGTFVMAALKYTSENTDWCPKLSWSLQLLHRSQNSLNYWHQVLSSTVSPPWHDKYYESCGYNELSTLVL